MTIRLDSVSHNNSEYYEDYRVTYFVLKCKLENQR